MGRALSGPEFFESTLTAYLEEWLAGLDVRVERQPAAPGRDNLLAWYDHPGARKRILFDVHQDTVPVGGMSIPPFVPTIERGRLYGRGSCDVKGSMATIVARRSPVWCGRASAKDTRSVLLVCTVDENTSTGFASRVSRR